VHAKKLTRPLSLSYSTAHCGGHKRDLTWPDGATLAKQLWGSADELKRTVKFIEDIGLDVCCENFQKSNAKKKKPILSIELIMSKPRFTSHYFSYFRQPRGK
jgi:hypothetical protein